MVLLDAPSTGCSGSSVVARANMQDAWQFQRLLHHVTSIETWELEQLLQLFTCFLGRSASPLHVTLFQHFLSALGLFGTFELIQVQRSHSRTDPLGKMGRKGDKSNY